jgi:hypothetical protein
MTRLTVLRLAINKKTSMVLTESLWSCSLYQAERMQLKSQLSGEDLSLCAHLDSAGLKTKKSQ